LLLLLLLLQQLLLLSLVAVLLSLPAAAAAVPKRDTASSSDRKPASVTLLPQSCGRGTRAVLNRHVVGSLQKIAAPDINQSCAILA
jgi:hypothetical protein